MGMTVIGDAAVMGLSGTIVCGTLTCDLTGFDVDLTTPTAELMDGSGNTRSEGFGRPKHVMNAEFTPYADTTAHAAAVTFALAGATVAVANTGTIADGNWNFVGEGTLSLKTAAPASVKMKLSRKGPPGGGGSTVPTAF
jgi:hypothetical protein